MNLPNRILFVAWQNPTTRQIYPVGRLIRDEFGDGWEFAYLQGAREAKGFSYFPSLPDLEKIYRNEHGELPPFLQNRLMPKSRPDRAEFIEHLGFESDTEDELPLLIRSEGVKETDTIEVFGLPSFDKAKNCYRYFFFVRGIRYVKGAQERIQALNPGDKLQLLPEDSNVQDSQATLINAINGERIGWAPRNLTGDLRKLIAKNGAVHVTVERINPPFTPIQLRLLCRLEASEVDSFTPFATQLYQPIAGDAEQLSFRPQDLLIQN